MKNYKFDDNDERNINFLICFSSLEGGFSFDENLIVEFTKLLYENEYSLILCFYIEENFIDKEKIKNKFECFKTLISRDIINGKIFLIKNFEAIKYLLNSMNFTKFDYRNFMKLREFMEVIDIDWD